MMKVVIMMFEQQWSEIETKSWLKQIDRVAVSFDVGIALTLVKQHRNNNQATCVLANLLAHLAGARYDRLKRTDPLGTRWVDEALSLDETNKLVHSLKIEETLDICAQ